MSRTMKERLATWAAPYWAESVFRSGQAAILAAKAASPRFEDLWDAEVKVFSQWGEDGIFDYLCDRLSLARPSAIELGAGNYLECDTRFLAEYRNAGVTVVDARKDLASTIRRLPIWWRTTIDIQTSWITPDTVPGLLAGARATHGGLDIISLDIDGNDYWVAQALDLNGVSIVMVEYNPLFGPSRAVTIPRNDSFVAPDAHFSGVYFGASLRAFVDLFAEKDFTFVGTNRACNNAFFVRADLVDRVPIAVPDVADLGRYTAVRYRAARDQKGGLPGLSARDTRRLIAAQPLIEVPTGNELTVGELGIDP